MVWLCVPLSVLLVVRIHTFQWNLLQLLPRNYTKGYTATTIVEYLMDFQASSIKYWAGWGTCPRLGRFKAS